MPEYNRAILNQNIQRLMAEYSTSQSKLASAIGMTQPNVSKALSPEEKKNFTLEQVVAIANFFHVSIDSLLQHKGYTSQKLSHRDIGRLIVQLMEHHQILLSDISVSEIQFVKGADPASAWDEATPVKRDEAYLAFYFSNYYPLPDPSTDPEGNTYREFEMFGNDTDMWDINSFIHQLKEVLPMYQKGAITQKTYLLLLNELLNQLSDQR